MTTTAAATKIKAPQAFMLMVDNTCDQIVSTEREARKEKADLIKMDCGRVRIKPFASWADAYAYEDKLNGY